MHRSIRWAALCSLFASLFSANIANAGMTTAGQFAVSPSGAATYTIPIQLPPGLAPTLSLSYSSQSGNDLLGMNWSLAGLSSITRCPQTMAQDGVRGAVNFDNNDRYCLDGQRLIAISGTYGANGTEYRTELDQFSKIVSYGTAGYGPAWFKVWTKAGQVMEYGNTTDSRIEAQGKTTAAVWALNKLSDSKGNYFTVTYTEDSANGDYYPQRIDYAGNSNTGTPTNNSVQFVYMTRPDITTKYHAGSMSKNSVRLTDVKTYAGATLVKDYQLIYEATQGQSPSRVMSIHECAGSGYCVPSIDLQFLNQISAYFSTSFTASQNSLYSGWNFGTPGTYDLVVGDLNGDGKTDFALVGGAPTTSTSVYTFLSNGDGTFTPSSQVLYNGWHFGPPGTYYLIVGDINGDGKTDFAFAGGAPGASTAVYTFLSKGDGSYTPSSQVLYTGWNFGAPGTYYLIFGDFNGDGKTDFAFAGGAPGASTVVYTFLSNGDGSFVPSSQVLNNGWNFGAPGTYYLLVGDFNGDGKTDFGFAGGAPGASTYVYTFLSKGDGSYTSSSQMLYNGWNFGAPGTYYSTVGDFNGDGKTDFAFIGGPSGASSYVYVLLSKGDGSFTPSSQLINNGWNFGSPGTYQLVVGDFNGDGKTDIGFAGGAPNAYTSMYVCLSNGDGTFVPSSGLLNSGWNFGSPPQQNYYPIIGDFNGDGKTDLIFVTGGLAYSFLAVAGSADVAQFKNGLGQTNSVTYKPLTDSTVYIKDSGTNTATYPMIDVQGPMSVVSSVATSDGIGGTLTNYYQYGGLKADLSGRGMLGFRWSQYWQTISGLGSRTEYRQDFPYIGAVSLAQKTVPGGGNGTLLSRTTTIYGCTDFISSSGCTVTPGRRYFVYPTQSNGSSWDLNGVALPTTTMTTQYDSYGNPTQIVNSSSDGFTTTTTNTYTNDTVNWFMGRLTRATVTTTTP
ncbi:MAG: FG-GAP-like repeat-containing protein [Burkholderiaceae bacterium]